jgi:hypothetical protein
MHRDGRPVDALTADWELASAGLPLYEKPAGPDGEDGETYATWLTRMGVDHRPAITVAYELQAEWQRESGQQPGVGRAVPEARGQGSGGWRDMVGSGTSTQARGASTSAGPRAAWAERGWPQARAAAGEVSADEVDVARAAAG